MQPNVFALVIYIPDPLGTFLDQLRRELVPDYNPHAHVSVLPPRRLAGEWTAASEQVGALAAGWRQFDIELTRLEVFPDTSVLYLEVGAGAIELSRMHDAMNSGPLFFEEDFPYHPHITVAQEIASGKLPELRELAQRRWDEYAGSRAFRARTAAFVQNPVDNIWVDLATFSLPNGLDPVQAGSKLESLPRFSH